MGLRKAHFTAPAIVVQCHWIEPVASSTQNIVDSVCRKCVSVHNEETVARPRGFPYLNAYHELYPNMYQYIKGPPITTKQLSKASISYHQTAI